MKQLIVNADDLGLSRAVNEGIFQAAKDGCVRSTTALAGAPAFQHGLDLLGGLGHVGIGIHLNLTGCWEALEGGTPPGFFQGRPGPLLRACLSGRLDLDFAESCMRRQIETFLDTDRAPTHYDSHHHVHLFPKIGSLAARIAKSYGIEKARLPYETWPAITACPGAWGTRLVVASLARTIARTLESNGIQTTDRFFGFGLMGNRNYADRLQRIIEIVGSGTSELMTHPGLDDAGLIDSYSAGRIEETRALTAPETMHALERSGIRLVSFDHLHQAASSA